MHTTAENHPLGFTHVISTGAQRNGEISFQDDGFLDAIDFSASLEMTDLLPLVISTNAERSI